MNVNEVISGKYLAAADLNGATPTVTIASVEKVEMKNMAGQMQVKLLVTFKGKSKGLVLNKTNTKKLAELYGNETDDWIGQQIKLITPEIEFDGEVAPAIRVRAPDKQLNPAPTPKQISDQVHAPPPPKGHPAAFEDDMVPF